MPAARRAPARKLSETYSGITRVEIINQSEKAEFTKVRASKNPAVTVDGTLSHSLFGASRSADTLYLIAFDGTIALPDSVAMHYKRGIGDLQKEMFDTYAPSLPYGEIVETQKLAKSLAGYRDIPMAETMHTLMCMSESNTRPFFTAQKDLSAPPTFERMERRKREQNFRWNGPYGYIDKIQAGNFVLIPDLAGARNREELWSKMAVFLRDKVYAKGPGLSALIVELNRRILQDAKTLTTFLLEVQPAIAETELHAKVMSTTALKNAQDTLQEGLEELRKKKIPFASTMAELYGNACAPISHEGWVDVMAETAAREAQVRSKGSGKKAPGSAKVVAGQVGVRDATNWDTFLNERMTYTMCVSGEALENLRLIGGFDHANDPYLTVSRQQLREWLKKSNTPVQQALNAFSTHQKDREEVEFSSDPKHNQVGIRYTGGDCDKRIKGKTTPSPSPAASPAAAPTKDTEKTWTAYASDFMDWVVTSVL
jgi:hypothetical protein